MQNVITADGRTLAVEQWGPADGTPVFYLHGSPMSRLARYPDDGLYERLGIQLITYDRPGFGNSTQHLGRRVGDAAGDVVAIADALGIERFPLFGVSGGGPHALAVAAAYPQRVVRVAALACVAPRDADGLDWTDGMMEGNQVSAAACALGRDAIAKHLASVGTASLPPLPAVELAVISRPEIAAMLKAGFAEATRPGIDGWIDDAMALYGGYSWGFDPSTIAVPLRLWHGGLDTMVPAAHGRWLAAQIPTATITVDPAAGHAGHFEATPSTLEWLIEA